MNIKITSDSTCDLSPELIAVNDIGVVALSVEMGGKYYRDGIDITPAVIFEHVDKGGALCSTSAVNADEYEQYFAPFAETYDAVVHINLGSGSPPAIRTPASPQSVSTTSMSSIRRISPPVRDMSFWKPAARREAARRRRTSSACARICAS